MGQPLNIAIRQPSPAKPETQKQKTVENRPVSAKPRAESSEPHSLAQKSTIQPEATSLDTEQDMGPDKTRSESNTETEYARVNNNMIRYLSSEFRLRFKYPMLARKRGWQGTVVVGLNITQQGRITQVAVQQSSGYSVLDRNAVSTFRSIEQLTPALRSSLSRNHSLSIPVIYNLTGG